jgi:hypothetical protein
MIFSDHLISGGSDLKLLYLLPSWVIALSFHYEERWRMARKLRYEH